MPRLGPIGEAGFKKTFTPFLRPKASPNSTLDVIFDQMLELRVPLLYNIYSFLEAEGFTQLDSRCHL